MVNFHLKVHSGKICMSARPGCMSASELRFLLQFLCPFTSSVIIHSSTAPVNGRWWIKFHLFTAHVSFECKFIPYLHDCFWCFMIEWVCCIDFPPFSEKGTEMIGRLITISIKISPWECILCRRYIFERMDAMWQSWIPGNQRVLTWWGLNIRQREVSNVTVGPGTNCREGLMHWTIAILLLPHSAR